MKFWKRGYDKVRVKLFVYFLKQQIMGLFLSISTTFVSLKRVCKGFDLYDRLKSNTLQTANVPYALESSPTERSMHRPAQQSLEIVSNSQLSVSSFMIKAHASNLSCAYYSVHLILSH